MNADVKAKWIEALESGKYEQGQMKLRTRDDRFCCLGVLCDVVGAGAWEKDRDGDWQYRGPDDPASAFAILPMGLRERVKLGNGQQGDLTEMNDRGHTFPEIAQWIRENL